VRVRQFGNSQEKAKVYAAVAKKYPGLAERSSLESVREKAKEKKAGVKRYQRLVDAASKAGKSHQYKSPNLRKHLGKGQEYKAALPPARKGSYQNPWLQPAGAKTSSALPMALGALVGAGSGAAGSLMAGRGADDSRKQLAALQAEKQDSFAYAMRLAKAKMQLAGAELSEAHPAKAALMGGVGGAMTGAAVGPQMARMGRNIKDLAG
jgi:hypothetical protein